MAARDLHIDAYIAHLKVERGLSAKTIEAYSADLGGLLSFLEQESVALDEVDAVVLAGWLVTLSVGSERTH